MYFNNLAEISSMHVNKGSRTQHSAKLRKKWILITVSVCLGFWWLLSSDQHITTVALKCNSPQLNKEQTIIQSANKKMSGKQYNRLKTEVLA